MDFWCDPIWNIAAVSAKNALYRTALPEVKSIFLDENHSQYSVMEQSQIEFVYRGVIYFY